MDETPGAGGRASEDEVRDMRAEAEKTVREIKAGGGIGELFSFEKMYFPFFARVIFIAYSLCVLAVCVYMTVISFLYLFDVGFFDGLLRLAVTLVFFIVAIVVGRVWIEAMMVVFKINEAVQDIRDTLRTKLQ